MADTISNYLPHNYQIQVHKACNASSKNFWTVVCAGRQSGKSFLAKYQTLRWAYENTGVNIWYVTPFEHQAKKVYNELIIILKGLNLIKKSNGSKGYFMIELINGSIIEFKSAAGKDSLRGPTINFMILDEAAWIDYETVESVLQPMMVAAKGNKKMLIISSPMGKNWFYKEWLKGQGFDNDYKSFKFTSLDNPLADKEQIEKLRNKMAPGLFAQEFLAEWRDDNSVFANISDLSIIIQISEPRENDIYNIGIDIGLKNDFTVITVINQRGEVINIDRFTNLESPQVKERIKRTYMLFKPNKISIEENGMGLPIIQDLKQDGIPIDGFLTTQVTKPEIINNLIAAFSEKKIRIPFDKQLNEELNAFVFEYSKSGILKFKAAPGFHDDMVMSLAIAWDTHLKNGFITPPETYYLDDFIKKYGKSNTTDEGVFIPDGPDTYIGREHKEENDIDSPIGF